MPSWRDGKLGLPVREAIKIFPELEKYLDERGRLDLSSRRARILYNKAIARVVFDIEVEYHPKGLITTPISRFIFLKTFLRGGERVLEIGTGHTAMMAIMAAKIFKCDVIATEIDDEFFEYAKANISANNSKVQLIKSNGEIINGIIPKREIFDVIFSAPPYYEKPTKGVLTPIEGIGGGVYGEEFAVRILREAREYMTENGKVALFLPDKPSLLKSIISKAEKLSYLPKDIKFKVGTRWRHSLIFSRE
ncbi:MULTISPECIES: RlmF-related methyltransferase [Thermococcus]|uniref:SAM-dependent methyltransferase, putative n=2 Tax=Thermococcus sibiricus TaxID=172049 RepID=C6A5C8_THESM|nr:MULTISPECIES: RlmF-related methyltransferase [Thermococcus]KUK28866.1 MAG: SAM-dependent methyltransferase, putative [Thermococcus sp. 40_45]HII66863.1 RlmF-related methyltransferase [Thermococcaceae archaeon]ACS90823.1 SAM-dependent methyltransferase, putative [Thermococcus sibiricus MM 739]KUK17450.1 MAG: SAM-dependent methyltransferase, putative [Thermococcus sibiricus]MBC7094156.1 RlmF-related methyltransferase [Thermococcus sp.]